MAMDPGRDAEVGWCGIGNLTAAEGDTGNLPDGVSLAKGME